MRSIEDKLANQVANGVADQRFRAQEFCRVMAGQDYVTQKGFFRLVVSYLQFMAVYDQYKFYPGNTYQIARMSAEMLRNLDESGVVDDLLHNR